MPFYQPSMHEDVTKALSVLIVHFKFNLTATQNTTLVFEFEMGSLRKTVQSATLLNVFIVPKDAAAVSSLSVYERILSNTNELCLDCYRLFERARQIERVARDDAENGSQLCSSKKLVKEMCRRQERGRE